MNAAPTFFRKSRRAAELLWSNPVLRREWASRRSSTRLRTLGSWLGLLLVLAAYAAGAYWLSREERSPWEARAFLLALCLLYLLWVHVVVPGPAAARISGERERRTWQPLLLTALRPSQVVSAKARRQSLARGGRPRHAHAAAGHGRPRGPASRAAPAADCRRPPGGVRARVVRQGTEQAQDEDDDGDPNRPDRLLDSTLGSALEELPADLSGDWDHLRVTSGGAVIYLVYTKSPEGEPKTLYAVSGDPAPRILRLARRARPLALSRDGRTVFFERDQALWRLDLREPLPVLLGELTVPELADDGYTSLSAAVSPSASPRVSRRPSTER